MAQFILKKSLRKVSWSMHSTGFSFIFFMLVCCHCAYSGASQKLHVESIWSPAVCLRTVKIGDFVRYHYYGMLTNGHYFDSSYERGDTYNVVVGSGWLIKGMDLGLLDMCINEHRLISIPPDLGYGNEESADGAIPPNSTLIFNVVLVDIWNDEDTIKVTTKSKPSTCTREIEVSDYVRYHYNGSLINGKLFHSSYDDEQTYNTYVGQGWLIKGMDEGLLGSCQGERRRIVIPPHMAYGGKGDGKNIPHSATIIFDVEIIDFHNPKDDVMVTTIKPPEDCPRKLKETDFVRYHYNGTLADGTMFDSSYQRHHTYDTYIGYRRLIPGMEQGLLGACMGEWKDITFPPHLGYGERGVDGKIPGSAVLTFHVHIIDFHNPSDDVMVEVQYKPDACNSIGTPTVMEGDYLTYDYELKLMDGTKIESSKDRTGTWGSYIGRHHLVPGVEQGLLGMCKGEKRRVVVPPHLGYGEAGKDDVIPGSAVLDFEFEIQMIEKPFPDGYNFVWIGDPVERDVVALMDADGDEIVSLSEFSSFVFGRVSSGLARLRPGIPREELVVEMFNKLDNDGDGSIPIKEFNFDFGGPEVEVKDEL